MTGIRLNPFASRPRRAAGGPEPIGLLACAGRFPIVFAEKARGAGFPVVGINVAGMADPELEGACTEVRRMSGASLGFVIRTFRKAGVRRFTMAGKFHKHEILKPWRLIRFLPDWRMLRFWYLRSRRANNDDSILLGLINEFRAYGLECVSPLELCPEVLVREGVLTRRRPTAAEERDIRVGWALAREMGRLDVGQSVMIRDRAVVAVEAVEGTDRAILRAGELCAGGGFVVVKVAKPGQDMRFDVPTVGVQTIESMRAAGGKVLAIEAGKTILIDEAETLARADRYGIAVTSLTEPPPG